ncbi:MAG: hypothetical protein HYX28_00175 [Candidatus Koribacter versatilis]|uniref:Uncharacterized protein n=1 Tax=Candidatus Korobacter versatilis TaxID=658062 RepID=A0A932A6P4_9BACT|nr:hypothetical protein [Candidatus Koribacter versatilis]
MPEYYGWVSIGSFASEYFHFLTMLGVFGLLPAWMIGGAIQGTSHGGGNLPTIFLISVPLNFAFYSILIIGLTKLALLIWPSLREAKASAPSAPRR